MLPRTVIGVLLPLLLLQHLNVGALGKAAAAPAPEVQTTQGRAAGTLQTRETAGGTLAIAEFLGLPYAAPPVHKLRWRPPQPAAEWSGVRAATAYGASCVQPAGFDPPIPAATQSEDCLFLNVFARWPPPPPTLASPVLVWVHGGGWSGGSSAEARLNGSELVAGSATPTVVVTVNYRLNVFGFLGSDALRSRDPNNATGNTGLQDQRAALGWVRANIAAFGGDPNNVFLVGESAGAGSVSAHLVMPHSFGLFRRAGMESGAFSNWTSVSLASAETAFQCLVQRTNCSQTADEVACLEAEDGGRLLAAWQGCHAQSRPVVDGVELADFTFALLHRGAVAPGVDVLAGSVLHDTPGVALPSPSVDARGLADWAAAFLTPAHASLLPRLLAVYHNVSHYPLAANITRQFWVAQRMAADRFMTCPARRTVRVFAGKGGRSFGYLFAHPPNHTSPPTAGVYHSSEIPFVFRVLEAAEASMCVHGPAEVDLSTTMANFWTSFGAAAAPADPTRGGASSAGQGPPTWPPNTAADDASMVFNRVGATVVRGLHATECDFWDAVDWVGG